MLLKTPNFWEWLVDFTARKCCWLKLKQPLKASEQPSTKQPEGEVRQDIWEPALELRPGPLYPQRMLANGGFKPDKSIKAENNIY